VLPQRRDVQRVFLRRSVRAGAVFRPPLARPLRRHLLDDARHELSDAAAILVCAAAALTAGGGYRRLRHSRGDVARALRDHRRITVARFSSVELARVCANLGGPLDLRWQHCFFCAPIPAVPALSADCRGERATRRPVSHQSGRSVSKDFIARDGALFAEFDDAELARRALDNLSARGYRNLETFSPFPMTSDQA